MALLVPTETTWFGFVNEGLGAHAGRTMMLAELRLLLTACPPTTDLEGFRSAILDDNVLLKQTESTRKESFRRLRELYGLSSKLLLLRALRDLWDQQAEAQPLVLAMDGSPVGRKCIVLMVGVVYNQRSLPLAWVVYKGQKRHAPASTHLAMLQQVLPLIPADAQAILLGDGEYDTVEMSQWLTATAPWEFVVRTAKSVRVYREQEWLTLGDLYMEPGDQLHLPDVACTQQAHGPLQVIAWRDAQEQASLYLLTNMELAGEACYWYRYRFRIETLFSDQKSRGFAIDKSHLTDPKRLARLLATALAYIWIVYIGITCVLTGNRARVDRVGRRDKSLFRLGLDWLKHLLRHALPFPPLIFKVPSLSFVEKL